MAVSIRSIAIVLACLSCTGHGEVLHGSHEHSQSILGEPDSAQGTSDQLKSLATLLLATDPSAAFNPGLANSRPAALESSSRLSSLSPQMKAIPVYDADGNPTGKDTDLSTKIARAGPYVVHRVLVADAANRRSSNAHCRTRSEVSGGGIKPYNQKGTGRARRGSSRSPLIVGGGKSHGPRNSRNFKQKINAKERNLAISTALMGATPRMKVVPESFTQKFADKPQTRVMKEFLKNLGVEDPNTEKTLIITKENDMNTFKSCRNLGDSKPCCHLTQIKYLTVRKILWAKNIIVTTGALQQMRNRYTVIGKSHRPGEQYEKGWQDMKPEPEAEPSA